MHCKKKLIKEHTTKDKEWKEEVIGLNTEIEKLHGCVSHVRDNLLQIEELVDGKRGLQMSSYCNALHYHLQKKSIEIQFILKSKEER